MNEPSLRTSALIGGLTSIPTMAILYLGNQIANLAFLPFDMFDLMARILPGAIITAGIDSIVSLISLLNLTNTSNSAKIIEQLLALFMFLLFGALMGVIIALLIHRTGDEQQAHMAIRQSIIGGLLGYLLFMIIVVMLGNSTRLIFDVLWIAIVIIGWGAIIGLSIDKTTRQSATETDGQTDSESRRVFIRRLGAGSVGIAIAAFGLGRVFGSTREFEGASELLSEAVATKENNQPLSDSGSPAQESASPPAEDLDISPAPGTRPELTPTEDFYRIDINTFPPNIEQDRWVLEIDGLFDNPRDLTLEELMNFPPVTQSITLSCISNRIGGDLIGTSNWTGLRLRELLAELGVRPEARSLVVEARDGFYETVTMTDMLDQRTLLVYGMNGETLPRKHGYPLRIYIPNRYGMKQPKWITKMTAVEDEPEGYWVVRGWSKEARPQIISVIDNVATDQLTEDNRVPVGGIAWAGDRGITKVEIQLDYGDWLEATLLDPPLSPLTWVLWRYDLPPEEGRHLVRVRATDGDGALQVEKESGVRPDGATGYHEFNFRM